MNYFCLDVGTTCLKCQLFSDTGEILAYRVKEYDFKLQDGEKYVDVDAVWQTLCEMLRELGAAHEITSVCISSLGESFVLLDEKDEILFYPMLYTDARGEEEARLIASTVGEERAFLIAGVTPHSMYSLSKLLWIKRHAPEKFSRAAKVMLVCDYLGYRLTGERTIDYALAARTGAFDVEKKTFSAEMLTPFGLSETLFSVPRPAGSVVGPIKKELLTSLGLQGAPVLVLGSHDQVCAALGAGALQAGDAVDGLGTVECTTVLFKDKPTDLSMGKEGYPCVPYAVPGLYCTYMLNFSSGSTIDWVRKRIMHGYAGEEQSFFAYIEKDLPRDPTGLLVLPYFGGASTPHQNIHARGVILGLHTDTKDTELFQGIMEGLCMEMRYNADVVKKYGIAVKKLVATGGGAKSRAWLTLKANVQDLPVVRLRSSEGGLCGCAVLSATAVGGLTFEEARAWFVQYADAFTPDPARRAAYDPIYEKYKKLYASVKELF
ncbi:MAG: hypothetical protein IJV96_04230 [Clostridia bacterium]|nr:hypothetical protein [Clostridia bacterium]